MRIFVLFSYLCLPLLSWAQKASFAAYCNAEEVVLGNRFELTFKMSNAKIKSLKKPDFKDFEVAGPSTSMSTSYINGARSSSESYTYYLIPKKTGKLKIGSATAVARNGQTFKTKPITVSVVKGSTSPNNNNGGSGNVQLGDKVFLRTVVSNTKAVVGEQITIDIKIYTQIGIEHVEIIKEPSFDNLFSHYVRSYDDAAKLEVISGKQYTTKVLRRVVVFPSKTGTIVVEPAMAEIGVATNGARASLNPFYQVASYGVNSMPVEIEVAALGNEPTGFQGAIGEYEMQTHVEKNTITSDDVVQLTLRIVGKGDIKQILPPELNVSAQKFELYKPSMQEDIREGGGALGGVKEFKYVMTPRALGEFKINPKFVFFDPVRKRFRTVDTTLTVNILKGKNPLPSQNTLAAEDTASMEGVLLEMKAPQTSATFMAQPTPFFGTVGYWILCLLPFGAFAVVIIWRKKRDAKEGIDQSTIKKQQAGQEAAKRLTKAKSLMQSNKGREFYEEVANVLLGYVSDKFNIPLSELSKATVKNRLLAVDASTNNIQDCIKLLETCDMALFAGMINTTAMQETYQNTTNWINTIENQLNQV